MDIRTIVSSLFGSRYTAQEIEQRIRKSIRTDNLNNLRYERRFQPSERTRAEVLTRE